MKKFLLALTMVAGLSALNAQTVVWSDDFDDQDVSDWTLYDEDGDGQQWYTAQLTDDGGNPTGTPILTSVSWNGFPLTPDNWAVSPAIDLTEITDAELKWFVFASDPLYNLENYGVYVATENTVEAFTTAGELFTEFDLPSELTERTLDLSAFDGQTIYVAFRHYDVSDQFRIGLDDISVSGTEGGGGDEYCIPLPLDCSDGDVIYNVTFAGIDNDSDCSPDGYGDYTALAPAQVVAGETYDIEMEIGAGWYEKVSLWIDFDNSMTFDESERFEVVEGDTGGVMTGSVTIPADAAEGTYRMRFFLGAVGSDNPYPQDPCNTEDTGYGEIEDYMISVGEGEPGGEDCNQEVLSNALENGSFLGGDTNQRLAVDITVAANTQMTISGIEPTIIIPEGGEATTFGFIFYADDAGIPGAEVDNAVGNIVSSTITGQNFGRDFIRYELTLDTQVVLEPGTYWMEMTSDAEGWETTTASAIGSALVFSNDSTSGAWVVDGTGAELVYEIVATCETLGVSDMDSFDFAYYPNPVKNELNISSQKSVKSVMVYNLAGQQVSTQKMNQTNGTVNTASLAPGVYIFKALLEGGQVETFKVIKK